MLEKATAKPGGFPTAAAVVCRSDCSESKRIRLAWADISRGGGKVDLRLSELISRISCSVLIIVGHRFILSMKTDHSNQR